VPLLGVLQQLARVSGAAPALCSNPQFSLEIGHAAGALLDAASYFTVGDAVANADVHVSPGTNRNHYQYIIEELQAGEHLLAHYLI